MNTFHPIIFLYGPPGSGKTTTGWRLAQSLDLSFLDLDTEIESTSGTTIAEIFARQGEPAFRDRERRVLEEAIQKGKGVVALGGGALLDLDNRNLVEGAGQVICLNAPFAILLGRVMQTAGRRPLLGSIQADADTVREKLNALLERRAGHYASFPLQLDTNGITPQNAAWGVQILLGWFRVGGMGRVYEVIIREGALRQTGKAFEAAGLGGPVALVSDENVAPLYVLQVSEALQERGYAVKPVSMPPGEEHKTPTTLEHLWGALVEAGLERGSSLAALGGGVVGDLAGFAAATYLRGVAWAALPTSLLAMCDASIGGKTGADLPQGKNLIGAFHPPRLVLADPETLASLPRPELRSGMAEVIKAGIIGDPALFALCEGGWQAVESRWPEVVSRAAAVKIQAIEEDPFEKGRRAVLNLGHTLGHAIEWASGYEVKHGEAVAIGIVAVAHLAWLLGLAEPGLEERIANTLSSFDLPVRIPSVLSPDKLLAGMHVDKKRAGGKARFVLPRRVGEVQHGFIVEEEQLCELFSSFTDRT